MHASSGASHLNARDVELLRHLAAGWSTAQIATAMDISGNTVRTRVRRVSAKLEVATRTDAVQAAATHGLL